MTRQHYHFDTTCIISFIDPEGQIFDVDREVASKMKGIISRARNHENIVIVISNPVAGELISEYAEKAYIHRLDSPTMINPMYKLLELKKVMKDKLLLGFNPEDMLICRCMEMIREETYLNEKDLLIVSYAGADAKATKFFTTDRDILNNARYIEKSIKEFRMEYLNDETKLDVTEIR